MKDNQEQLSSWRRLHDQRVKKEAQQISELRAIAFRAVSRPESLTEHDIQDVAWAYLMIIKGLPHARYSP